MMNTCVVSVLEGIRRKAVNPGYERSDRALSYALTQEFIAPKECFFARLKARLNARANRSIKIMEPGVGPAPFISSVIRDAPVHENWKLNYTAADISCDMIRIAADSILQAARASAARIDIHAQLFAPINCLCLRNRFMRRACASGGYDVILTSQFEHYLPNDLNSPLAARLRSQGICFTTKSRFRRALSRLLRPGGMYVTIDDFDLDDQSANEESLQQWDAYVVEQLSDRKHVEAIGARSDQLAERIRTRYDAKLSFEKRLRGAAEARLRRRQICLEECGSLIATRREFLDVFDDIEVLQHPMQKLRRFAMLIGTKA